MNRHIFLPTPFRGTPTNSTLNFVLRIHHEAQSRNELLILVYNNGGTHAKPFPLPHSIRFLQLAPRTVLHMNFPTGTPNTLEVDLPWYVTGLRAVSIDVIVRMYMACSMANRTGSGFHAYDFLEILRIDKLT